MLILPDEGCKETSVTRPGIMRVISGTRAISINLHAIFSLIFS